MYNSTWQNLHHRRPRLENDFYHGEIIRLGRENGVPTPVNERALELLEAAQRAGEGPETLDRDGFRDRFADVVNFDLLIEAQSASTPSGLEI